MYLSLLLRCQFAMRVPFSPDISVPQLCFVFSHDLKLLFFVFSCALLLDFNIHVWDIRRPYIPSASFPDHKDVTTGMHAHLACAIQDCVMHKLFPVFHL